MNRDNILSLFIILIPIVLVSFPTLFIDMKDYGKKISFRPPPIVFSFVWPILLILVGISWYISLNSPNIIFILFVILTLLLASWTIIYKYSKVSGLINILLSFITCLYLAISLFKINKTSSILLIPLVIWLIFAGILNINSIK